MFLAEMLRKIHEINFERGQKENILPFITNMLVVAFICHKAHIQILTWFLYQNCLEQYCELQGKRIISQVSFKIRKLMHHCKFFWTIMNTYCISKAYQFMIWNLSVSDLNGSRTEPATLCMYVKCSDRLTIDTVWGLIKIFSIPDDEHFSETPVGCTALYFAKIFRCYRWFVNSPHMRQERKLTDLDTWFSLPKSLELIHCSSCWEQ